MRMDEMNKLFEEQGFEVERKWLTEKDCYEFHIRRDGEDWYCHYTYPNGTSGAVASKHQKTFVEQTIGYFDKHYGSKRQAISHTLQTAFIDLLKDLCRKHGIVLQYEFIALENKHNFYFFKDTKEEHITVKWNEVSSALDALAAIHRRLIEKGFAPDEYLSYKEYSRLWKQTVNSFYGANPPFNPTQKFLFKNHKYIRPLSDQRLKPEIKDVIFSPPATIVKWDDGTKTVVKVQNGEDYDPEKGLAMAISKKALGNDRTYYHTFIHWLKKYEKQNVKAEQGMKRSNTDNDEIRELKETWDSLNMGTDESKSWGALYKAFGIPLDVLNVAETADNRRKAVQKAYDLLVKFRDTSETVSVDDVIGYLGEALED